MANCLNVGFIGKLFLPSLSVPPPCPHSASLSLLDLSVLSAVTFAARLVIFFLLICISFPCLVKVMLLRRSLRQILGGARCHTRTHRNTRIHTSLNSTSGVKPSERLQWERKTQMPPSHTHDETQNKIWKRRRFDFYDKFALIFLYADYIWFTVHCKCVRKASRTACWKTAGPAASPLIFGGAVFAWCHGLISIDFKGVSATHIGTMW